MNAKSFSVAGHKISKIYLSDAVDGAPKDSGKFVTLKLERTNLLVKKPPNQNQDQSKGPVRPAISRKIRQATQSLASRSILKTP
ncbi:hypothetical protein [Campylobacter curvus]|uniref:hypothetical protein n=1 Tax=Campylobacter curvus TaxID=200 RepID=UPI0032D575A9